MPYVNSEKLTVIHLRELSQKVQVSHTGVSEDFEKALASDVGE